MVSYDSSRPKNLDTHSVAGHDTSKTQVTESGCEQIKQRKFSLRTVSYSMLLSMDLANILLLRLLDDKALSHHC